MKEGTVYQRHLAHCPRDATGNLGPHRCRGSWAYVLDAGRDSLGKRRQLTRGGFATRSEARAALREMLLSGSASDVASHRLTVAEYLKQWLEGKRALRPSTLKSYQDHLRLYLVPHLGHLRLKDLSAAHVDQMITSIASGSHRALTATTIHHIHATLRTALNAAVRRRLLAYNPALQVELPVVDREPVTVWTHEQLAHFLTSAHGDRLQVLYYLVALTGLRRGEVLGLRWSDVDLDRKLVSVRQQVVQVSGHLYIGPPKTRAGRRVVPLDQATAHALLAHRTAQEQERVAWGDSRLDSGLVFTREDGSALSPDYVTRYFRTLSRRAGLPEIRFHDLRHTSASIALTAGVAMKVVSERLGHSTTGITADLYTHVNPAVAQDAADAIARLVAEGREATAASNVSEMLDGALDRTTSGRSIRRAL